MKTLVVGGLGGRAVQMEDGIDALGEVEGLAEMIGSAFLARAYREAVGRDPRLAAGYNKLAVKHSARVVALAEKIGRAAQAQMDAHSAGLAGMQINTTRQ